MNRRWYLLFAAALAASAPAQSVTDKGMLVTSPTPALVGHVSIPDDVALVPTSAMTVEAWAYLTSTTGYPTIVRKGPSFPSNSWLIRVEDNGTTIKAYINIDNSPGLYFTASVPNVGNAWHHYALTYDGSTARLYLDGAQVAFINDTGVITFAAGNLLFGKGETASEQWFGMIDEVRLWSVARTAVQIQADRFFEIGPTPGLLDAWRLNGNFQDSIGTHHGTQVGTVQTVLSTSPVVGTYLIAPAVLGLGAATPFQIVSGTTGLLYIFDVSVNGTSPGVVLPPPVNLTIPLNPPWLHYELNYLVPPGTFQGFLGVIPASHHAFPILQLPGEPALTGITVSSAFVLIDPALPTWFKLASEPRTSVIGDFAPDVTDVDPDTIASSGGAVVTITGDHFQAGATVLVDGAPATNVVVNGPTSITATTPAGSLGPADVTVTNPDTLAGTLAGAITYVPTPVLSSISPLVPQSGATVTISGSAFAQGLQLTVGGSPVPVTNVTPSSITFTAPASVPCDTQVTVTNPDNQAGSIGWNPAPVIQSVYNNWGSAAGGGEFFIVGQFTAATTVTVGGTPASISGNTAIALLVTAPPGTPGPQPVVVSSASGCTANTVYVYQ
jgi:Concanavalin A-like lectin/glucanases superfamily/IPT/TIG domain